MSAINDIIYCNTDVKAGNKFIMVTSKHLNALESAYICYREVRYLTSSTGTVYHNIAVNHYEFDKALSAIQNVNSLEASKAKLTFI